MDKRRVLHTLIKKIILFIVTIFCLITVVFVMSRVAPGDPLVSYYGESAERMSTEERADAIEELGLDKPLPQQYLAWWKSALRGDFGISYKYKQDVLTVIRGRIGNTLILGAIGFGLTFFLALVLGILCAFREGKILDRIICRIGTVLSCIPEFWMSLILILVFSVILKWLPSSGAYDVGQAGNILSRLQHMILPLAVIVMSHVWYYGYMIRNKLLEENRCEYVLFAKGKGLTRRQVMRRHCVRNILPAYISIMALSLNHILEGTYIVEMVFSYPGIGTLSFESAKYHDYNMLMVLVIITGVFVIAGNIVGQLISERIDRRMKSMQAPIVAESEGAAHE